MGVFDLVGNIYYYVIEAPVNGLNNFMERQHAKRKPSYWYHREYRRVTPIEDCKADDLVCMFEAEQQYKRDKMVEEEIIRLLQSRMRKCAIEEGTNAKQNCKGVVADFDVNADNFHAKYNGLGGVGNAVRCMMKQKYRVYNERKKAQEESEAA